MLVTVQLQIINKKDLSDLSKYTTKQDKEKVNENNGHLLKPHVYSEEFHWLKKEKKYWTILFPWLGNTH